MTPYVILAVMERRLQTFITNKTIAIPCSGRMLTPKSSSWLRALMRSNSSWMTWGQSVISWRHDLGEKKRAGRKDGRGGRREGKKEEEKERVSQHFISATATQRSATERS